MKSFERWEALLTEEDEVVLAGRIKILPEHISQMIAAGEVVERPSSVVKELIENSIDAESSEIIVELKRGGLELIRVVDNGEGIPPEDVSLALERFATSKIKSADDLYSIHTLGFRGEALPSIASVSKMTIKTRVDNSLSGTKVICEGGKIIGISEIGCPKGTEVEVRDIFFNLPVKRKFLKSIQYELRHSLNQFLRTSLAYPWITWRFIHDGHIIHELIRSDSLLVRLDAIFGHEVVEQLQRVEYEDGGIKISGFSSNPTVSKGNSDGILFYINRRYVRDRIIHKAILDSYRHIIPSGRFPVTILFISLPPSSVDVNVHPTKMEVKFKEPERIYQSIRNSLQLIFEEKVEGHPTEQFKIKEEGLKGAYPSFDFRDEMIKAPMLKEEGELKWEVAKERALKIIGQVQRTYIICEGEGNIIFIDQHAAHERILFERFKKELNMGKRVSQKLLIPIPMEVSKEESLLLESIGDIFEKVGFEIETIGGGLHAIQSVPSFIDIKDPKAMVRKILDDFSLIVAEEAVDKFEKVLISMACHSAIREGLMLVREEMEGLIKNLSPFNYSTTCPHGRPIFYLLGLDDLAKEFRRR